MQKDAAYPYIFGASVPGSSHIRYNIPCQDAFAYCTSSNIEIPNFGIIAIADGLGSAKNSDTGAKIAVESVIQRAKDILEKNISEHIDLNFIEDMVAFARNKLELKANEERCGIDEFACTIIVIIINNDNILIAHIGDGAVVGKKDNSTILLSGPEESEYANEVTPLTVTEWKSSLRTKLISDIECIAAFTDGCQRAVLQKSQIDLIPYNGFFDPLFSYAHEIFNDKNQAEKDIEEFLSSQRMDDISNDDKTLIVAILKDQ